MLPCYLYFSVFTCINCATFACVYRLKQMERSCIINMSPLSELLPQINSVFFFQCSCWNKMKANLSFLSFGAHSASQLSAWNIWTTRQISTTCAFYRRVRRKNLPETYLLQSTLRNLNAAILVLYQLLVLVAEATAMGSWITIVIRSLASNYNAMLFV